jgi:hypothetical protein
MTFDRMVGIKRRLPEGATWTRAVQSVRSGEAAERVARLAKGAPCGTFFRVRPVFLSAERATLYVVVEAGQVKEVSLLSSVLLQYEGGRLGAVVSTWEALGRLGHAHTALNVAAELLGRPRGISPPATWKEFQTRLAELEISLSRTERLRLGATLRDLVPFYRLALAYVEPLRP